MSSEALLTPQTSLAVALEFEGVTKTFPGVVALDNVNLQVRRGEVHGIVGENGAGKSTLMAIATGAVGADHGSVMINGTTLSLADPEAARKLGIAIVRQEPALLPDLTVAENFYLAVSPPKRPSPKNMTSWASTKLAVWGDTLAVDATDRVEQLNPQQRFIVEICRALAQEPSVLVLDEPTEHLLRDEVDVLFARIREETAKGTAVIYISHRIPEVKSIAERITVLRNGRAEATHEAATLTEDQIVRLIIGRKLDFFFPDKPEGDADTPVGLKLSGFTSKGLAPINMEFLAGEVIGLAGIEGNGQHELLRSLAGIERSHGQIEIFGQTINRHNQRSAADHGVAYLSGDRHNEGVLTGLNVRENISFRSLGNLGPAGWVRSATERQLARGVIDDFSVKTPTMETPIESLSGGNQQKALMGGVLVSKPQILLVDEPTQGVDVGAKSEIYTVIRAAAAAGAVVIVRSSSSMELEGLTDRVLVFSRGHVIRELRGSEVSESEIAATMLTADTERQRVVHGRLHLSQWLAGDNAPIYVLSALIASLILIATLSNPVFVGPRNITAVLMLAVPLSLVAFGQLLVMLTGGIDLSAGPLMGLVAIVGSYYLVDGTPAGTQAFGWGLILMVALVVGVINWILVDLVRLTPLIATLVTYMAVQALSFILRPTPGGSISSVVMDAVGSTLGPIPIAFVACLLLAAVLNIALRRSHPGIALRAVGSREEAARINGLSPRVTRFCAFVGCSVLTGLAGVAFMAQIGTGDAGAGISYTLIGISAAVVGGASVFGARGSFIGALLGAVMVQVVNSLAVFLRMTPEWQYYLVGIMTLGAVALYSLARSHAASRH